jgi:hypothetical protein
VIPPPEFISLSNAEKDALIARLVARLSSLEAQVARLEAENAALREKLKLPPKTPDNSSTPPSQGKKPSGDRSATNASTGRRKAHAGAHRPLHPNLRGETIYDLAERLTGQGVPLVFVTGYGPEAIDGRFANVPVLQKPVDSAALRRVLNGAKAIG